MRNVVKFVRKKYQTLIDESIFFFTLQALLLYKFSVATEKARIPLLM